jgi:hypothetical protein
MEGNYHVETPTLQQQELYLVLSLYYTKIEIMQFLHSKYVLYNDIKMDNFMLRKIPEGYELVIVDMGAANVYE